ncbi:hypothetical protein [Microcoleus sp. bin38.metabat.b11b12b14.051]|nr:hypothetical protein [Microcoleus sp. bin38.metabat.b11b12b14.051]
MQRKKIKPFLLWAIGSIHEVIYVLTAVAIAIAAQPQDLDMEQGRIRQL